MGVQDFINKFIEKKKEEKEMQRQITLENNALEKARLKKLNPMERELEKYKKQEHDRKVQDEVLKIRRKQKYDIEMKNIPINQKNIFREDKNLFSNKNIFTSKKQNIRVPNVFAGENIFTNQPKRFNMAKVKNR